MTYNFYDTSSLLVKARLPLLPDERFTISSVTLEELEKIKTSNSKSEEIKYLARKLLHFLNENYENIEIIYYHPTMIDSFNIPPAETASNDIKILACAAHYDKVFHPDEVMFYTNDLSLKFLANILYFGIDSIAAVVEEEDTYCGYKEICMSEEEMCKFYENPTINFYDLHINEYIIVKNLDGEIQDKLVWDGVTHQRLKLSSFVSTYFGDVRPLKDDPYQVLAFDSLVRNQITMLSGKPGSGKTWISLSYLFSLLGRNKIDRIVIFCNPVVAKDAAKLGFYPGDRVEKILSSQVGGVLSSKIGGDIEVIRLIEQGKLVLVPAGDARGYEVPENSGVYILESQNLTSDLLRLLLQRISDTCKVIVDGDYNEQVDMEAYAIDNGMQKMSKVFRGEKLYGQVELKTIHRSEIARIADKMK